jgi:glycosyltransferase involved in cell wall biosynthesis
MKILFVSARFPYPPHRGDRLTAFHLLRTFSRRHEVTLLSFIDGTEPPEALPEVAGICHRVETVQLDRRRSWVQAWTALPTLLPSQVAFYTSADMRRKVAQLLRDETFDVVFTQLIRMAPHVAGHPEPPRVLFLADSLALALDRSREFEPAWKWPGIMWERWRMGRYETGMSRRFDETWVLSDVDRQDLVRRGAHEVIALPHGVDERPFEIPIEARKSGQVFFLGNLSVPHNVDAALFLAREIWPGIHDAVPGARLIIGGADPRAEVLALRNGSSVTVPGAVPDLLDAWRTVAVLVAPLRFSTGIQNKVIEAMAAGVPVVTTPAVAAGIGASGDVVLTGGTATELRDAAVRVLAEPERFTDMTQRARAFVRAGFSWDQLERRLAEVAAKRPPASPAAHTP